MDILRVLCCLLCFTDRSQLLWRVSPQTPMEPGGTVHPDPESVLYGWNGRQLL